MANSWYNLGAKEVFDQSFDIITDTIQIMAVTSSYSFDRDHDYASTPAANEITATSYARQNLGSKAITVDDTNDRAEFDCADIAFGAIGNGANNTINAFIIFYDDVGGDSSSTLIAYIDVVSGSPPLPYTTDGSSLTLEVSTEGLLHLSTV